MLPQRTFYPQTCSVKDDLKGQYRRWWIQQFSDPTNLPKLRPFRLFKTSLAPSNCLNKGPSYFRPAALRFMCSNHRLDIELGRHNNIPRSDRKCCFCSANVIGEEYHAFQCSKFLDLSLLWHQCTIKNTVHPHDERFRSPRTTIHNTHHVSY